MSARDSVLELKQRIAAGVVGREAVIDRLRIALPAKSLESEFRRIQFRGPGRNLTGGCGISGGIGAGRPGRERAHSDPGTRRSERVRRRRGG